MERKTVRSQTRNISQYCSGAKSYGRVKEIEIPDSVKQNVQVNYQNVLPSNLRHGNNHVMPLLPKNVEGVSKADLALLKRVIQTSSYTLAQY